MSKKLTVGIIGNSLSGLFSGIALQSLGHNVHLCEKVIDDRKGAGLTLTPPAMDYFEQFNIFNDKLNPQSKHLLSSYQTSIIDMNNVLHPIFHHNVERIQTTWDNLYHSMMNKIENKSQIYFGKSLKNISVNNKITNKPLMKLQFDDNSSFYADLIIGADGISSKTRNFIQANQDPKCKLNYAGYIIWRGVVPSNCILPNNGLYKFQDNNQWVIYHGDNNQFLNYIVPNYYDKSDINNLYNWGWYVKYTNDELIKNNILTDKYGETHQISMPRTLIRDDIIDKYLMNESNNILPSLLHELIAMTKEPMIQVIIDYKCNSMAQYFEDETNKHLENKRKGGIVLVGDAPYVLRPHLIRATSKGAGDAMCLYKYLLQYEKSNEITFKDVLERYNEERSGVGITAAHDSIELGKKVVLQTGTRDECAWCYVKSAV
eukprot:465669_1